MSYRYLVEQGCIPPLCDLLTLTDAKTVQVALNGIDNILKAGQQSDQHDNPYAVLIEECFGEYPKNVTRIYERRFDKFHTIVTSCL